MSDGLFIRRAGLANGNEEPAFHRVFTERDALDPPGLVILERRPIHGFARW